MTSLVSFLWSSLGEPLNFPFTPALLLNYNEGRNTTNAPANPPSYNDICFRQWVKSKKIKHQCSSTDTNIGIGYNCTYCIVIMQLYCCNNFCLIYFLFFYISENTNKDKQEEENDTIIDPRLYGKFQKLFNFDRFSI